MEKKFNAVVVCLLPLGTFTTWDEDAAYDNILWWYIGILIIKSLLLILTVSIPNTFKLFCSCSKMAKADHLPRQNHLLLVIPGFCKSILSCVCWSWNSMHSLLLSSVSALYRKMFFLWRDFVLILLYLSMIAVFFSL